MVFSASLAACWLVGGAAGMLEVQPNFVLGTQEIYGGTGPPYSFTSLGTLEEQAQAVINMGGNQFKVRLAKEKSCSGYNLQCGDDVQSLRDLARHPEVAAAFAKPEFRWYHLWLYSFVNNGWQQHDWTNESLDAEYKETKEWALHMLETYKGSGKVFMAGNWEGDWTLLGMSGCKNADSSGYNKSCPVTDYAVERMVQWGRIRQKAIDDAVAEAQAPDVTLLYYMEFNLGDHALEGKRCVVHQVLPAVNPDLVSYSSYTTTNAFKNTGLVLLQAESAFQQVMSLAESKLQPKSKPELTTLGFKRRTFVGEYGSHEKTDGEVVRFTARVVHGALQWGAPFVLYWEIYDAPKSSTVPIVPESGDRTPLWHLFHAYFGHVRSLPAGTDIPSWALDYFTPREGEFECNFVPDEKDPGPGYAEKANTQTECCDVCSQDPTCMVAIFKGNDCFVRYSPENLQAGSGTACVKKDQMGMTISGVSDETSVFPANETADSEPGAGGDYTMFTAVIAGVFALLGVAGAACTCMRKASGLDVASREATLLDGDDSGEDEDV